VAEKRRMTVAIAGGTREVEVPRLLRRQPALNELQVAELARLARMLEQQMGWPVDVECAYVGDKLYLLQCRPITTLEALAASTLAAA
jgi:pyruvate,water dikinase